MQRWQTCQLVAAAEGGYCSKQGCDRQHYTPVIKTLIIGTSRSTVIVLWGFNGNVVYWGAN